MFRATTYSSSGGQIIYIYTHHQEVKLYIYIQHFVSSLAIGERGGRAVHRLREELRETERTAVHSLRERERTAVHRLREREDCSTQFEREREDCSIQVERERGLQYTG
jgi:hypothetical protein